MIIRFYLVLYSVNFISGCILVDRTLQCSGINLTEIPSPEVAFIDTNETIFDKIQKFDLSFNAIQIPLNLSNWSNNSIEILDLSHNEISQIDSTVFEPLIYLKELNLSNNKITLININWSHLPKINSLNLSYNNLRNALNIFTELWKSSVTYLNLSNTSVFLPSADVFSKSVKLKVLDLSVNDLSYIPNLPANLEYFDFSNNSIRHLDQECFSKDIRLRILLLENNKHLNEIGYEAFSRLLDLRMVSFKGCSDLSHLPASLFYYNKKLEHLSLSGCNFKNISALFKPSFLNIKKIDLEDNPWHCSPHIKWFVQLHDEHIISDDVRCSTPENISLVNYLGPKVKHKVVRILLTMISVILFCMLITAIAFSFNMEKKRRETLNSYAPLERSSKPYRGSMIYVTSSV